ncbi:hypothetical protein VB636_18600, partial [Paracoccus sp. APAP_BH8]
GSTYQCRPTVGTAGESRAAHAFGAGFDGAAVRVVGGSRVAVGPRRASGDGRDGQVHHRNAL